MLGETRREYIVRELSKVETRRFLLRANVTPSEVFVFLCSRPLPADESSDGVAEPAGMLKLGLWLGNKNNDSPKGARSRGECVFASCGSSLALQRKEEHCAIKLSSSPSTFVLPSPRSFLERRESYARKNATKCIYWIIKPRYFSMLITAFGQKCRVELSIHNRKNVFQM